MLNDKKMIQDIQNRPKRKGCWTGLKLSEEHKAKISNSMKGKNTWIKGKNLSEEHKKKIGAKQLGRKHPHTEETKRKMSLTRRKDGMLVVSEKKHLDGQYRYWMFSVKGRDNWKCKINNSDCKGRLEAHHILNWKEYSELRYDINNGITLCRAHHPLGRAKEKEMISYFMELLTSKEKNWHN